MPDETTYSSAFIEWARKQTMSLRARKALDIKDFMPLCGSDNRAKSMSCETCPNWELRNVETCRTCYWHDPENYQHVATVDERRLTITTRGEQVATMDALKAEADTAGVSLAEWILGRLSQFE